MPSRAADMDAAEIVTVLKRSADWQLANPSGTEIRDWITSQKAWLDFLESRQP